MSDLAEKHVFTKPDKVISDAIKSLSKARILFIKAKDAGLVLGNDNHIGDLGEYWVMKYYSSIGKFKRFAPAKNSLYDIELLDGTKVSVKTTTSWSECGYGTQIKPLCGKNWSVLAAVILDEKLSLKKLALVPLSEIMSQNIFIANESKRMKGAKTYPRFQWWDWLDEYVVYPKLENFTE